MTETDLKITRSGEFEVAIVSGNTDEGIDMVDAWVPSRPGAEFTVHDAGVIVIAAQDIDDFTRDAENFGLSVSVDAA